MVDSGIMGLCAEFCRTARYPPPLRPCSGKSGEPIKFKGYILQIKSRNHYCQKRREEKLSGVEQKIVKKKIIIIKELFFFLADYPRPDPSLHQNYIKKEV